MMYSVGDKISIGKLVGEIVNKETKTWIGFHPHTDTRYDILIKSVPEEEIKQNEDGTD